MPENNTSLTEIVHTYSPARKAKILVKQAGSVFVNFRNMYNIRSRRSNNQMSGHNFNQYHNDFNDGRIRTIGI